MFDSDSSFEKYIDKPNIVCYLFRVCRVMRLLWSCPVLCGAGTAGADAVWYCSFCNKRRSCRGSLREEPAHAGSPIGRESARDAVISEFF